MGVKPFVKQVDTLAAEFPASTNYLYMTYSGRENDIDKEDMVRYLSLPASLCLCVVGERSPGVSWYVVGSGMSAALSVISEGGRFVQIITW